MKMLCNVNFSTNEKYAKLSKVNLSASKNMYLNIAGDSFPSSEVISTTGLEITGNRSESLAQVLFQPVLKTRK